MVSSDETNDAIRLATQTEAMITDPVYEGKSMQALIDLARVFPDGSNVLFVHLGALLLTVTVIRIVTVTRLSKLRQIKAAKLERIPC